MVNELENAESNTKPHDLKSKNVNLHTKLKSSQILTDSMWILLSDISRRLQISSASIKAAETSMLGHDIFWDAATQHEFLRTIDVSVDEVSRFATLISYTSRLMIDKVEVNLESQMLQEIFYVVQRDYSNKFDSAQFDIVFQLNNDEVFVDFEYLCIAIRMLIHVISKKESIDDPINLVVYSDNENFIVEMDKVNEDQYRLITNFPKNLNPNFIKESHLSSEQILMIYIAYKLCDLQNVKLKTSINSEGNKSLQFIIPPAL